MPYPEQAEGFQVDSPDTYTDFHKRSVRVLISSILSSLTTSLQFQLKPSGAYGEMFLHKVRRNVVLIPV